MRRLLGAVVWLVIAAALVIERHRKRRREREGSDA